MFLHCLTLSYSRAFVYLEKLSLFEMVTCYEHWILWILYCSRKSKFRKIYMLVQVHILSLDSPVCTKCILYVLENFVLIKLRMSLVGIFLCENSSLCSLLVAQCAATMDSLLVRLSPEGVQDWNITFVRAFNDWEVDIVALFFQLLNSHIPSSVGPDGLGWKL
jgi:hypothetical protein